RGFLFGSAAIILVWLIAPFDLSRYILAQGYLYANPVLLGVQFGWLAVAYLSGELDRRDSTVGPRLGRFNFIKYPLFAVGLVGLGGWLLAIFEQVRVNVSTIFSNPAQVILSCVVTPIVGATIVWWETRKGRTTMV